MTARLPRHENLDKNEGKPVSRYAKSITEFLQKYWQDSVYENNYQESHKQAMRSNFPVCEHLFEQFHASRIFDDLLSVYVRHTHDKHWDINQFGAEFPAFLEAQYKSSKADDFPWQGLSAVANLEVALNQCYYGGLATDKNANLSVAKLPVTTTSEIHALVLLLKQLHPYMIICPRLIQGISDDNFDPGQHTFNVRFAHDRDTKIPRLTLYACTKR